MDRGVAGPEMREGSTKTRGGGLGREISKTMSWYAEWVCRVVVDEYLSRGISEGSLTFEFADSTRTVFGEREGSARAKGHATGRIFVEKTGSFYARVAANADIGFAEAFMAGDFTVEKPGDLVEVFKVLIANRDSEELTASGLVVSRIGGWVNGILHRMNRNTISGSQRNIEKHYDLSNELFSTFLGNTWVYSCGYYGEGVSGLDEAQYCKMDMILDKARIDSSCHVLEIGCGWGELGIRAVERFGCRVTGITISKEQLVVAEQRAKKAGVSDKIDFELVDYRVVAERGMKYDRIISVEMMEALGHEFLGCYFQSIQKMLGRNGLVVLQVITTPEQRYEGYKNGRDFIQKHIFPGGLCPSLESIVGAVGRNSKLVVENVENIGVHYATTLKEWRRRFLQSVESGEVEKAGFDGVFIRKWVYYFCYCEAGFATRTLGDLQIVLTGGNNVKTLGGMAEVEG